MAEHKENMDAELKKTLAEITKQDDCPTCGMKVPLQQTPADPGGIYCKNCNHIFGRRF